MTKSEFRFSGFELLLSFAIRALCLLHHIIRQEPRQSAGGHQGVLAQLVHVLHAGRPAQTAPRAAPAGPRRSSANRCSTSQGNVSSAVSLITRIEANGTAAAGRPRPRQKSPCRRPSPCSDREATVSCRGRRTTRSAVSSGPRCTPGWAVARTIRPASRSKIRRLRVQSRSATRISLRFSCGHSPPANPAEMTRGPMAVDQDSVGPGGVVAAGAGEDHHDAAAVESAFAERQIRCRGS